ncbi:rodlin [Actinacidiphila yeochonensis]|uniref:rodlin n=1 Tax=Actinacidiphila yeochonensis TaxID=89050 RepID=UPI00056B6801|nr:rodlin [Actinacidiphila yeochonensis]
MRTRTLLAACGLAAAVLAGTTGVAAARGPVDANGNGSVESIGNTKTSGVDSPQIGLVQGSLNKPCVAVPIKADVGSLIGLIPITVQDVNVLNSSQNQQCTQNSSQTQGDGPLSHILSDDAVASGNGTGNGAGHGHR